ncbi:MAG: phosphate acyltransferase PlsX [Pseudomonadota bacterium]
MSHSQNGVRVVLDAMGGDYGPEVNLHGSLLALSNNKDLTLILVGDEKALSSLLKKPRFKSLLKNVQSRFSLVHADEVISMDDSASTAVRKKINSSIHVGLKLVKEKKADAFVSMGNSGAIMVASMTVLGRLPEIERPAIIVKVPTHSGFVFLLDAGANVDCKPSQLVRFAEMGRIYLESVEKIKTPRVGLLSNGSESHKGNELTRSTHELLEKLSFPNYFGYVEGYDVFNHTVDLVVCDGFIGNVTLKVVEGFANMVVLWFRRAIRKDIKSLVGLVLMKKLLQKFKNQFHYQSHGAAPLLGSDGVVFIGHGKSREKAICNGILAAAAASKQNLIEDIRSQLEKPLSVSTP